MPSKTYNQFTLNTAIVSAPNDLVAAYPVGGPLYAITFQNFCKSITQLGALTAELVTLASATGTAGFNVPHGAAPTAPVNGDIWTTTGGVFARVNGATQQFAPLSGGTFTGEVITPASTTGTAGFNVPHGTAPSGPQNGDVWTTTAGYFARINGSTVQLSTGSVVTFVGTAFFGDGSDGNVTINAGTTTLSRDMYYNNLTLSGTGVLNTNGWRVFGAGTLDISAAAAGAIICNGGAGGNAASAASGGTAGAVPVSALGTIVNNTDAGSAGNAGQTGVGTTGTSQGTTTSNGGGVAAAGAGGAGTPNAGGATGGAQTATAYALTPGPWPLLPQDSYNTWATLLPRGGHRGESGGSGGGDATNRGGACGGGGGAGGPLAIFFNIINRGAGTPAGCIQAKGGNAGNGFAPTAGNTGGAGGSSGGGGGLAVIMFVSLTGATATNCIDVSGGDGANGTNGFGTGVGGDGGGSGQSGKVYLANLGSGITVSTQNAGVTGTAHSGITGGAKATATVTRVSL